MSDHLLEQILGEIKGIKDGQQRMEYRLDKIEYRLDKIEVRLDNVEYRLDKMEVRMDGFEQKQDKLIEDVSEIKAAVKRIEDNQPKDIMATLHVINRKIDIYAIDIGNLKKKTAFHDEEIRRLDELIQA